MKNKIKIIVGIALLLPIFVSCSKETTIASQQEEYVKVDIALFDTRGPQSGDPNEKKINTLKVLGYKSSDKTLAFKDEVDLTAEKPHIKVLTGKYDFVFIANDVADSDLKSKLDGLMVGKTQINALESFYFDSSAFGNPENIPMITSFKNVTVAGDNEVEGAGVNHAAGIWTVTLTRIGVKIELSLKLKESQYDDFKTAGSVYFDNIPDKVYLFPKLNEGSYELTPRSISVTDLEIDSDNSDATTVVLTNTNLIILPETLFDPVTAELKGIVFGMKNSDTATAKKGTIASDRTASNYTIPRNIRLVLKAEIGDAELDISSTVKNWDDEYNIVGPL